MTYSDIAAYFSGLDEQKRAGFISPDDHKRRSNEFAVNVLNMFGSVLDSKSRRLIHSRRS